MSVSRFQRTISKKRSVAIGVYLAIGAAMVTLCPASIYGQATTADATAADYVARYQEVQRAILVFQQGNVSEAKRLLELAAEQHSELPPVDTILARLYFASGDSTVAESLLEKAVVDAPEDPEAFVLLGDVALRAGRLAFAQLAYQRAQQKLQAYNQIPERAGNLSIRVYAGLASVEESRGRFSEAEKNLTAWLDAAPRSPVALGSLGRVQFSQREYDRARATFQQLKELAPNAPPAEIAMGRLFGESGQFEAASEEMQAAAEKYADDTRALLTVCEWAMSNGQLDLAESTLQKAFAIDAQSLEARAFSARLARYRGDTQSAEATLSKLLPLRPNSALLADEFARTLALSDDVQKRAAALEHAQRYYESQKNSGNRASQLQSVITYGWALFRNGEPAKAETVIQAIPDGSSITNENGYYVARIYAGRGKVQQATNMLSALLSDDSAFPMRAAAEQLLQELSRGDGRTSESTTQR